MAISNSVPKFLPSVSGLHFVNHFASGTSYPVLTLPVIGTIIKGDAGTGLCDGFVFTVLDLFLAKPRYWPPPDTDTPQQGSPLFNYLCQREIDSFGAAPGFDNAVKQITWIQTPSHDTSMSGVLTPHGLAHDMVYDEWPRVKADIDAGCPSPLTLVRAPQCGPGDIPGIIVAMKRSHQVLAYAYSLDDSSNLTISVYDPNGPDDNNSTVALNISDPNHTIDICAPDILSHFADQAIIRGFFRTDYSPRDASQFSPGIFSDTLATPLPASPAPTSGAPIPNFPPSVTLGWQAAVLGATGYHVELTQSICVDATGTVSSRDDAQNVGAGSVCAVFQTALGTDGTQLVDGQWRVTALDSTGFFQASSPSDWCHYKMNSAPATVFGKVVDNITKAPLAATIAVYDDKSYPNTIASATTGADGSYSFSVNDLPVPKTVGIWVYPQGEYEGDSCSVTVSADTSVEQDFELLSTAPGTIVVTVTTQQGSPLGGVTVTAGAKSATTDPVSGQCRLSISEGIYDVSVFEAGYERQLIKGVTVVASGTTPVKITLTIAVPGTIRGTVTDDSGKPLGGAKVLCESISTNSDRTTGAYVLPGVLSGPAEITASLGVLTCDQPVQVLGNQTITANLTLEAPQCDVGYNPLCKASAVSPAKHYNAPFPFSGVIFKVFRPLFTLRMISAADFVQTKGWGLLLFCLM